MQNYLSLWHSRAWEWFVEHAARPHALFWLALVAFSDAIISPLVPEAFLAALMLAHPGRWKSYLAVAATFSMLGAVAGYFVAAFLFEQFGQALLALYHLQAPFMEVQHMLAGHVFLTMAGASFTPLPDKVFIYAGGFLGVHLVPFVTGYFLGRTARMALICYLVGRYGAEALKIINRYLLGFAAFLLALLVLYGMVHWHLFGL